MTRRAWLGYAGAGVVAAVAGGVLGWRRLSPGPAAQQASQLLFSQTLTDLHGTPQPLGQWRGQTMVVNFWATWCAPCVQEMPELDGLQHEFDQKVRFLGIGIDTAANMQAFVQKIPVRYPLLVAGTVGTELSRQLGNTSGGLPFTVVIDEKGAITYQHSGKIEPADLRARLGGTPRA